MAKFTNRQLNLNTYLLVTLNIDISGNKATPDFKTITTIGFPNQPHYQVCTPASDFIVRPGRPSVEHCKCRCVCLSGVKECYMVTFQIHVVLHQNASIEVDTVGHDVNPCRPCLVNAFNFGYDESPSDKCQDIQRYHEIPEKRKFEKKTHKHLVRYHGIHKIPSG